MSVATAGSEVFLRNLSLCFTANLTILEDELRALPVEESIRFPESPARFDSW